MARVFIVAVAIVLAACVSAEDDDVQAEYDKMMEVLKDISKCHAEHGKKVMTQQVSRVVEGKHLCKKIARTQWIKAARNGKLPGIGKIEIQVRVESPDWSPCQTAPCPAGPAGGPCRSCHKCVNKLDDQSDTIAKSNTAASLKCCFADTAAVHKTCAEGYGLSKEEATQARRLVCKPYWEESPSFLDWAISEVTGASRPRCNEKQFQYFQCVNHAFAYGLCGDDICDADSALSKQACPAGKQEAGCKKLRRSYPCCKTGKDCEVAKAQQ